MLKNLIAKMVNKFECYIDSNFEKRLPDMYVEDLEYLDKTSTIIDNYLQKVEICIFASLLTIICFLGLGISVVLKSCIGILVVCPILSFFSVWTVSFRKYLRRFGYKKKCEIMNKQQDAMIKDISEKIEFLTKELKNNM